NLLMSQKTLKPQPLNTISLVSILSTKDKRNQPSPPSAILLPETFLLLPKKSSSLSIYN
ncbi:hypothetical protein S83_007702, partial [Arachis hypogaea]